MRIPASVLNLWSVCCCLVAGGLGDQGHLLDKVNGSTVVHAAPTPPVTFNLRTSTDPEDKGCYLNSSQPQEMCGLNMTAKTFFIIHGWKMVDLPDTWLDKMVSALKMREQDANVVVVNWISLAYKKYATAVNNCRVVGHSVARMLDWLQGQGEFSLGNVHLIGYSLGAHVAGYAGNFVNGTVGRITGLDPAGPFFESAPLDERLSPDDADFVDVLHTNTYTMVLSVGIQRPVGHIDIYPNGGDSQPGCQPQVGIPSTFLDRMECQHERSVHLFVDSLVNRDKPSFAFQCTDSKRFKKGICLSCRKNRCNSIGYYTKKMRNKRNSKMYLNTRASMPFRVYHYQMKIHIFNYKTKANIQPNFYVILNGTNADSQILPLTIVENIKVNATNTFLVYTEEDLGDLLKIKLTWNEEKSQFWDILDIQKMFFSTKNKELSIRRIRVKSGETQRKLTFCVEDFEHTSISPGQELWFHKCRDGWRVKNQTSLTSKLL